MRRWVCPTCSSGVLAPKSPHVEDVRRFCLECSAKRGRLVRRTCPSTKRVSDARKDAARARRAAAKSRRESQELKRWTVAGVDLRELWHKVWVVLLPIVRARISTAMLAGTRSPRLEAPKLTLKRRAGRGGWFRLSWVIYDVELTLNPNTTADAPRFHVARTLAIVALGGVAAGVSTESSAYNDALSRVAKRLWGLKIPRDPGPGAERSLRRQLEEKFGKVAHDSQERHQEHDHGSGHQGGGVPGAVAIG